MFPKSRSADVSASMYWNLEGALAILSLKYVSFRKVKTVDQKEKGNSPYDSRLLADR